jgi:hypothetical protein
MGTKVYGHSDDLIEFEGDLRGEVGCYGTDDDPDMGTLVAFSDGTVLSVKYGKNGMGIWAIFALRQGDLFDGIDPCTDEDADVYSDVARFRDGPLKAWAARNCEKVR